jgi:hypothetical protein
VQTGMGGVVIPTTAEKIKKEKNKKTFKNLLTLAFTYDRINTNTKVNLLRR